MIEIAGKAVTLGNTTQETPTQQASSIHEPTTSLPTVGNKLLRALQAAAADGVIIGGRGVGEARDIPVSDTTPPLASPSQLSPANTSTGRELYSLDYTKLLMTCVVNLEQGSPGLFDAVREAPTEQERMKLIIAAREKIILQGDPNNTLNARTNEMLQVLTDRYTALSGIETNLQKIDLERANKLESVKNQSSVIIDKIAKTLNLTDEQSQHIKTIINEGQDPKVIIERLHDMIRKTYNYKGESHKGVIDIIEGLINSNDTQSGRDDLRSKKEEIIEGLTELMKSVDLKQNVPRQEMISTIGDMAFDVLYEVQKNFGNVVNGDLNLRNQFELLRKAREEGNIGAIFDIISVVEKIQVVDRNGKITNGGITHYLYETLSKLEQEAERNPSSEIMERLKAVRDSAHRLGEKFDALRRLNNDLTDHYILTE